MVRSALRHSDSMSLSWKESKRDVNGRLLGASFDGLGHLQRLK